VGSSTVEQYTHNIKDGEFESPLTHLKNNAFYIFDIFIRNNNMNKVYTKELLEQIVKESKTIRECLNKLGNDSLYGNVGNNYTYFSRLVKEYSIDTSHFLNRSEQMKMRSPIAFKHTWENIFCENSKVSLGGNDLKKRLYKKEIKVPKCEICGIKEDEWVSGKISMILDHINGNRLDNRIKNLRIVCPNCDSTLPTSKGRNKKKKEKIRNPTSNNFLKNQEEIKQKIISSNIDFSKYGWGVKLGIILSKTPQRSRELVKILTPEIWETCSKHKS
jgi:hypothetical protein